MGITSLWDILEPVKQTKRLDEFRGEKLAIDFSNMLVECETGSAEHKDRSVFCRVLDLMKNGITPVFVIDSFDAPHFKKRQRGSQFSNTVLEWKGLLMTMGFQVIQAPGEAEKTCAYLTRKKLVAACVTNDGDALAYGATTVIKDYKVGNKEIHVYEMKDIEEHGLSQQVLIAAALLIGCDYCPGVEGVGKETFLKLVNEQKKNGINYILERIQSWHNNHQLIALVEKQKDIKLLSKERQEAHCRKCLHLGTISKHQKHGCPLCETKENCKESEKDDPNIISCTCRKHVLEKEIQPFSTELKVAEKALIQMKDFEIVVSEFLIQDDEKVIDAIMMDTFKDRDCPKVMRLLKDSFKVGDVAKKFFPALIVMSLYSPIYDVKAIPLKILQKCKRNKEPCYKIKFKKLAFDDGEEDYEIEVVQSVFDSKFPDFSSEDDELNAVAKNNPKEQSSTQGASKNPRRDKKIYQNQPKITDMYKIKKKSNICMNECE